MALLFKSAVGLATFFGAAGTIQMPDTPSNIPHTQTTTLTAEENPTQIRQRALAESIPHAVSFGQVFPQR